MNELPAFLFEKTPGDDAIHPIWAFSTLSLHRNLKKYPFSSRLTNAEGGQLIDFLKRPLMGISEISHPIFLKGPQLSHIDKEFIFEHFLCLDGFANTLDGQAFLIDAKADLLVLLNLEDHIQIQMIDTHCDIENSYQKLSQIESKMNSLFEFAFHPQFGYLTPDVGVCGTGLVISTFLHVPALIHAHKIETIFQNAWEEDIFPSGLEGQINEYPGDLLILSNLYTLGNSEETIVNQLKQATLKIMALEETLRTHLKSTREPHIIDLISRAYGLIINSYQLEIKEALNALSLLKLAAELQWLEGVSAQTLITLFFKCRKAHLAHIQKHDSLDESRLSRERALFLHEQLKSLKLLLPS